MKMRLMLLILIGAFVVTAEGGRVDKRMASVSGCAILQEALNDYAHLKPGMVRKEVEKYFEQDGGAQFPSSTRYTYPKCSYIHVDVEFDPKGTEGQLFSRDDKVTKVSRMYVDYSVKD